MTHHHELWSDPQTFVFEGQRIRFGSLGTGRPIVLLHGTPFSSLVWRRIAPLLAGRRRVYHYDLLGYGRSEMRAGQDVSLAMQSKLFAALLAHWGLDRPDVVAHDFGGCTALRATLLGGCEYASLMLIDPVALSPWGSPLVRHVGRHEEAFAGLPADIHAAILQAYLAGATYRSLSPEVMRLYVDPWTGPSGQPAFYRQIAQMDQRYTDEIEARYGELRCRVMILWGEQDQWIPLAQGRKLAERMPNATLRCVREAGHLVQEDAPEAIVAALHDFLEAV